MVTSNLTKKLAVVTEEAAVANFEKRLNETIYCKSELTRLLKRIGLGDRKVMMDVLQGNSSSKRYSLKLITESNNSTDWLSDIIIDFRFGYPTWEQFIDVTYGVGSRYDKKIIVYENDLDEKYSDGAPAAILEIDDLVKNVIHD